MVSIVGNWDTEENFWDMNAHFKNQPEFSAVYKKDKSKKKKESSKLMWAIALYCDVNEKNIFRNATENQKRKDISEQILKDSKFNWDHPDIEKLIKVYRNVCLTVPEKHLQDLEAKLVERGKFIKDTGYTLDSVDDTGRTIKGTATQLDKMLADTKKIYDQIEGIKEQIAKQEDKGQLKGDQQESYGESGVL